MANKISVDFDDEVPAGKEILIPEAPKGGADKIVEENAGSEAAREKLVCTDLLDADSQEKARKKAREWFPVMLADTNQLMAFGEASVARLNALVDQMRENEKPVNIPELATLMRKASYAMSGLKNEYDISDPRISKKIDDEVKGKLKLFRRGGSFITRMKIDLQDVDQQIDSTEAELVTQSQMLLENIHIQDQLYIENERQILSLIRDISVMEQVLELAKAELKSLMANGPVTSQRSSMDRSQALNTFIQLLETKIADYKNHMFVGSTNSQQIIHARTLAVGLAMRLNNQMKLTVPTMKSTMFRWIKAIETRQAAELSDIVAETANDWMTTLADASEASVAELSKTANSPTITAETITHVAESAVNEADSMLKAYLEGQQKRSAIEDAMVKGRRKLEGAEGQMNSAVVDSQVHAASKRLSSTESQ